MPGSIVTAWRWVGICLLSVVCCEGARASSPELGVVTPRGWRRGTETNVFFQGARLSDAKEILCYSPGLVFSNLKAVNDNQVQAHVKIAADCRLGEHGMRVRTATGISELRTFYVGALPCIDEKEPNSDFTAPQKIPLNVTVHGVVENEDVDYFAFEAKKGQRVSAEIEAMRLGTTFFDPYIAILDKKRFELASCDDAALLGQDGTCSVIIPADGTYVVEVRESSYGGNGACSYRLHVGTFPRPTGVLPAGGKPGEEIEVRLLGDPTGEMRQKVKLPAHSDPKFGIFAQDSGGISPSPIPFRVSDLNNVIEVEPNDTQPQATKAVLPCALNGVISKAGDVDYYRFAAKKGQAYDVHCYARRLGSPLDSVMYIGMMGAGAMVGNDDAIGPDSYIRFTAPEDKEYWLSVTDHLGKGGANYFYRVELTPVHPQLTLSIPKVALASQERQAISVPRGNRYATLISAARADFGGDLVLSADGLPKGMTMTGENMPANLDVIPVLFEAAKDASLSGKLVNVTARHVDPAQKISGGFSQVADLVIGPPNISIYWHYDVDREAVAVTDEAPFKIQIVEPKVPLVQNGSMNLKVMAERKPGFKAPITIVPIFNPPGVGSASAVGIPEGQSEVLVPMNANSGAQVRKWKIVVNGVATVGNGPVWVGSQLATLEVAAPYVNLAMERAAVDQGKSTDMFCKVQVSTPFEGKAKVKLIGLPNGVTAPDVEIAKDTKEFSFHISTMPTSPAGLHKNLFCQLTIMRAGEPILHNLGGSELRLDVPLPKTTQTAKASAAKAAPAPAKPAEKRLTRLEKLRLEQEEREKAAKSPDGAKAPGPKK
jgi:hypothetical protein